MATSFARTTRALTTSLAVLALFCALPVAAHAYCLQMIVSRYF